MQNRKALAYVFVSVVLVVGLVIGLSAAQQSTPEINASYSYANEEVNYDIDGNPYPDSYDISLLEQNQTLSGDIGQGTVDVDSLEFSDNGNGFHLGSGNDVITFDADTPYAVSSSTNAFPTSNPAVGTLTSGDPIVGIDDDGQGLSRLYIVSSSSSFAQIHQLEWDNNGAEWNLVQSTNLGPVELDGLKWIDSGSTLLTYETGSSALQVGSCGVDYDISTCSFTRTTVPNDPSDIRDLDTNEDNSRLYLTSNSGEIFEYDFDNNYEVSNLRTHTLDNSPVFFHWSHTGDELITSGEVADTVVGYSIPQGDIEAWVENSAGSEIAGTRTQAGGTTGSISYSPTTYSEITANYENTEYPDISGQSDSITIYGSGNVTVHEEQTNNLITQDVNVTAYGEESGIYSLDTSDGTVDITGLPDQSYTFSVSSNGYVQRNKYVERLGDIDTLYLLSNESDRVTTQFLLEDTTNTYDSESRLIIERSIEGNGNDWETIYSDAFGTEGVSTELQQDERYRISIENEERRQTLGPYRATLSESVTISPESGTIEVDSQGSWEVGANYANDEIHVQFQEPESQTDSISVSIFERGNRSNTLVENDVYTNPSDLQLEYAVPNQYNDSGWIVEITRESAGESTTVSFTVGPTLETVPENLDPLWRNVISVVIILTFGLAFSVINRAVGAIVLALVGGLLWWVGWLAGATAGVLITAYLFIAMAYGIYTKSIR